MNEHRFIELLNLYLDHQIGPDEAAELEAAVYRSPERRRTYEEYCRLQRACCQLGNHARVSAPAAPRFTRSLQAAERKLCAPRRPHRWYPLQVSALASLAMAAGFVLVVQPQMPWSKPNNPPTQVTALITTRPSVLVVAKVNAPSAAASLVAFNVHPAHVASGLVAAPNTEEIVLATPDPEALAWMQRVDQLPLQRLVVDEQAFASRAVAPPDTHAFRHPHNLQPSAEFTGFQLQR